MTCRKLLYCNIHTVSKHVFMLTLISVQKSSDMNMLLKSWFDIICFHLILTFKSHIFKMNGNCTKFGRESCITCH